MFFENLISIVIPVYNAEAYLKECLDSILHQTYKNLQIIVIDDGSVDNSYQICGAMQQNDCRIELYYQENSGPSAARNIGLQYVKGEYLLFVDADDYLQMDAITKLRESMETEQADLACFEWSLVKEGQIVGGHTYTTAEIRATKEQMFENILLDDFLNGGGFLWNKMWRVTAIKKENMISFAKDLKKYEDKLWVLQNLLRCKKVVYVREKFYNYRLLPYSLSHGKTSIDSARQFFLATDRIVEFVRSDYSIAIRKAERWSRTYLAGLLFRGV